MAHDMVMRDVMLDDLFLLNNSSCIAGLLTRSSGKEETAEAEPSRNECPFPVRGTLSAASDIPRLGVQLVVP